MAKKQKEEVEITEPDVIDEEVETLKQAQANQKKRDGRHPWLTDEDFREITVICEPPVSINGVRYEGEVKVPRHIAQTIIPMIQAKRKIDLEIHMGKNRVSTKLADGTLVIKEGSPF